MSDRIALFSGVCSILLAALIGFTQVHQNFKQSRIDKRRHAENVELEARKFIAEHYEVRGLIPLCAIAVAYDPHRFYYRKMYNDFRLLPKDVQCRIFEHCEWHMCDYSGSDFMFYCMDLLRHAALEFLPSDRFDLLFNDDGKYMSDVIDECGDHPLPHLDVRFKSGIASTILDSFDDYNPDEPALGKIYMYYGFGDCDPLSACQTACTAARYIAVYAGQRSTHKHYDVEYGYPGGWAGEEIETLEDLFLQSLFYIWSSLHDVTKYSVKPYKKSLLFKIREFLGSILLRPVVIIDDLGEDYGSDKQTFQDDLEDNSKGDQNNDPN